jgi:hypothetical protein
VTEECPHGLEDPAWCSTCKHGARREPQPEIGPPFRAGFEGHCNECNLPIAVGQEIRVKGRTYIHRGCL